ncbi:unnamed protein product [Cylindrotheca closterium]|uniref:Uncharacterized protein n=1 Tax=Cylindrotheca closterium TaxID=2856 RepID=A0AAD2FI30_9STRA|nr:unnamed protein product [Cylindrotheca closterium]
MKIPLSTTPRNRLVEAAGGEENAAAVENGNDHDDDKNRPPPPSAMDEPTGAQWMTLFESISPCIQHAVEEFLKSLYHQGESIPEINARARKLGTMVFTLFQHLPCAIPILNSPQKQRLLHLIDQANNATMDAYAGFENCFFLPQDQQQDQQQQQQDLDHARRLGAVQDFESHLYRSRSDMDLMFGQCHPETVGSAAPSGSRVSPPPSPNTIPARYLLPFLLQRLSSFGGTLAHGSIFNAVTALVPLESIGTIDMFIKCCLLQPLSGLAHISNAELFVTTSNEPYPYYPGYQLPVYSWDDISDRQKAILLLADVGWHCLELCQAILNAGFLEHLFDLLRKAGDPEWMERIICHESCLPFLLHLAASHQSKLSLLAVTALENTYYRCNSNQKRRMSERGCGIYMTAVSNTVQSVHGSRYTFRLAYCPAMRPRFSTEGVGEIATRFSEIFWIVVGGI